MLCANRLARRAAGAALGALTAAPTLPTDLSPGVAKVFAFSAKVNIWIFVYKNTLAKVKVPISFTSFTQVEIRKHGFGNVLKKK